MTSHDKRAVRFAVFSLGLALAAVAPQSFGSGLEVPEAGAIGLGRGGAVVGRSSDPSTMMYNPAGLVALPGFQMTLGANFGFFSQCFSRYGNYTSSNDVSIGLAGTRFENSHYADRPTPYPTVCNNPSLGLAPNLLMSYRILPQLAVGIGLFTPHTVGRDGTYNDSVDTINGPAPSPARNLLYQKSLILLYPTITVAAAPLPWLRIGLGIQPSWGSFDYSTNLSPIDGSSQSPDLDVKLRLRASGMFVAGNAGIQILLPRGVTLGVKGQWVPPLDFTGPGAAEAVDRLYSNSNEVGMRTSTTMWSIDHLRAQPPWHIRAGARFAMPRPGHRGAYESAMAMANTRANAGNIAASYDPMRDDAWDIEVDFNYEATNSLDRTGIMGSGTIMAGGLSANAPANIMLRSYFRNTYGLRVGGDFNVVPDMLALRAGFSAETGAVVEGYSQLHLPTYDSLTAHFGGSLRLGWFTAHLSVAHLFFAPIDDPNGRRITITPAAANLPPNMSDMPPMTEACPAAPSGKAACMVNAGRYVASMTLVGLSLSGRW
jgi:long-chain fatty acid transport protein